MLESLAQLVRGEGAQICINPRNRGDGMRPLGSEIAIEKENDFVREREREN